MLHMNDSAKDPLLIILRKNCVSQIPGSFLHRNLRKKNLNSYNLLKLNNMFDNNS